MKLRTLCCNRAVLKKDITRFAPVWAIYLVGGLLVMLTGISDFDGMRSGRELSNTIPLLAPVNLIYAAVCAQMLFGDLFQTRMCNALHAMPLRRETWFATHVTAGLLFSLVPHGIAVIWMSLLLKKAWFLSLIWLLGMTLQYLFFFGLAVFSVFCVGNRVAQAAVYGILNFGAAILYWFIDTIYAPIMYGVQIPEEPFMQFCPVAQILQLEELVEFERIRNSVSYQTSYRYVGFGDGWDYLAICAGVGLAALVLGLLLYRRRKLETAGNFIAVKPLEPIFAVVFTLCCGAVFAAVGQLFGSGYLVYLIVGLIVGWFVGQMLLRRTVRVFQGRTFWKLGAFALIIICSLMVTDLDPLGITNWVPQRQEIVRAEINRGSEIHTSSSYYLKLEEAGELDILLEAHKAILALGDPEKSNGINIRTYTIRYTLQSGRQVSRTYYVESSSVGDELLAKLYGSPQTVLGYEDWEKYAAGADVSIDGIRLEDICTHFEKTSGLALKVQEIRDSLMEALRKDCELGTLTLEDFVSNGSGYLFTVTLRFGNTSRSLSVFERCYHTGMWYIGYEEILKSTVTIEE